jgi:hypothetical protein
MVCTPAGVLRCAIYKNQEKGFQTSAFSYIFIKLLCPSFLDTNESTAPKEVRTHRIALVGHM